VSVTKPNIRINEICPFEMPHLSAVELHSVPSQQRPDTTAAQTFMIKRKEG
jgi:hypothetical protein